MRYLSTKILILCLAVVAGLAAYNYFHQPFWPQLVEQQETAPTPTPTPIIVKKTLTDRDKITQLMAVAVDVDELLSEGSASASLLRFISDYQPGVVVYFGQQVSATAAAMATQRIYEQFAEQDYKPLVAVDHEGGSVQRLSGEGFTKLDPWQRVVGSYSPVQQKAVLSQSAKELYEVGVNIVFAPVVDLASGSAVLGSRAAADINQVEAATTEFIYAFAQYGIMPVLKHFPGIGTITRDPHVAVSSITVGRDDAAIFGRILDIFSNIGVMSTHVRVRDKFDNVVCSLSVECVGKLGELYPRLLLFTDDLAMPSALSKPGGGQAKTLGQAAIEAVQAGNHVLVFGNGVSTLELEQVVLALQAQHADSASFRELVEMAASKVLEYKR